MDTKKWGPHGWKFLHCVTINYNPKNRDIYKKFFNLLADILPCKYCRMSYQYFIKENPINNYLKSSKKLFEWLYLIHNCVNNKLRCQKESRKKDPSFNKIYKTYYELSKNKNYCRCNYSAWYFIHSIIVNYSIDKKKLYNNFFKILPKITIHTSSLVHEYKMQPINKVLNSKEELIKWSYYVHRELRRKHNKSYSAVCTEFNKIQSK